MDGYEILALFMRYIFVLLGTLILLRSFLWLRKDARAYRKEIRNLPDAGLVGEMVNLDTGESYPLPREGMLGTSRACDIRIKDAQMGRKHAAFLFTEGKGLVITPIGRRSVMLDGEYIEGKGCALHGTRLEVGNTTLRVRLFAGLNVPRRPVYQQEEEMMETEEETAVYPSYDQPFCTTDQEWKEEPYGQQDAFPPFPAWPEQPADEMQDQDSDMDMTWKYAPFPPQMAEQGESMQEEDVSFQEEQEENEEDNSYTPPFETERHRRHRR